MYRQLHGFTYMAELITCAPQLQNSLWYNTFNYGCFYISGVLSSPHFPANYPHDLHISYVLTSNPDQVIKINFLHFDIENSFQCFMDYLEITDGDDQLAKICENKPEAPITTSHHNVLLLFHTNDADSRPGWSLEWTSVRCPRTPGALDTLPCPSPGFQCSFGEECCCGECGALSFICTSTTTGASQWEPTSPCTNPTCGLGCQDEASVGTNYTGTANTTNGGVTCMRWTSSEIAHYGDHNYCRNSDGTKNGVWCFTDDFGLNWDYCAVPACGTGRKALDALSEEVCDLTSQNFLIVIVLKSLHLYSRMPPHQSKAPSG